MQRDLRLLKSAPAGRRFREFRKFKIRQTKTSPLLSKLVAVVIGTVLVFIGLGIGWLPGPGGFLGILGCAILLPFVPGMAAAMDRVEIWLRRFTKAILRAFQS